eukprot:TRINITY_DN23457_c0_g1_i1.p1 TRINITY_DN23457_c0_g1~~TRINITY_DN23457_c0_g1_i1.p1  ORF type:complete len:418 (+),score=102.86 TRINITY_DN23457_c0_g1_i1:34-1287(+)
MAFAALGGLPRAQAAMACRSLCSPSQRWQQVAPALEQARTFNSLGLMADSTRGSTNRRAACEETGKVRFTAAVAAIGCAATSRRRASLAASTGSQESRPAVLGDAVLVHYEGKLEDGTVFDSSEGRSPLSFTLGQGQVVPGFEEAVLGLTPGEVKNVSIPPDKAYGEQNDALVMTVDKSQAPAGIKEGMTVQLGSAGRQIPAKVTKIAEDGTVTVDANHVLAGKTLDFRIELVGYRQLLAPADPPPGKELATFAAGCFWGVELAFQRIEGVESTCVGYAQGTKEAPTYEEVCRKTTGHTEAVRVVYDPNVVSYGTLLETLWERVGKNATTMNRAGNDEGPQYRSGIYFHSDAQKAEAETSRQKLQERLGETVVTEVEAAAPFWMAEDYHQQYLEKGGRLGNPQSAAKGCKDTIRCYG